MFDRGAAVVVAQQEAPAYWGISMRVGSHMSLFNTGSGHVLLAFRSAEERAMMIAEYERHADGAYQPDDSRDRLDQIRERGYEMMPSAQTGGVFNISAAVHGPDGKAIAAMTIPYIQVLNVADVPTTEDVCRMIVATAQKLSEISGADIAQSGRRR